MNEFIVMCAGYGLVAGFVAYLSGLSLYYLLKFFSL